MGTSLASIRLADRAVEPLAEESSAVE